MPRTQDMATLVEHRSDFFAQGMILIADDDLIYN
ncbi:hypothetical protein, partial, partial [Absidia glauca]